MESCPLCDSIGFVDIDMPCYSCGLSVVEIADEKRVAIVPGHYLLDRSKVLPPLSIRRLLEFAECMVLDLSQLPFLSSAAMYILVTFNTAAKQRGSKVVFAEVGPHAMEVFRICRLHKVFRIVETVDDGLEAFRSDR